MHPREALLNQIHYCLRHDVKVSPQLSEQAERIGLNVAEITDNHTKSKETQHGNQTTNKLSNTAWPR